MTKKKIKMVKMMTMKTHLIGGLDTMRLLKTLKRLRKKLKNQQYRPRKSLLRKKKNLKKRKDGKLSQELRYVY